MTAADRLAFRRHRLAHAAVRLQRCGIRGDLLIRALLDFRDRLDNP